MKKMKKIFLFTVLLLVSFGASAEKLDERKAAEFASRFFSTDASASPKGISGNEVRLVMKGGLQADPSFYVFNRTGGGFVIVGSDTKNELLLGYSYENSFSAENMPANVAHWMALIAEGAASQPAVKASYGGESVHKVIKFLNTAKWSQDAPYNNLCPDLDGRGRSVTGCTNTATATIMYYHKWPAAGHGDLPDYSYTVWGTNRRFSIPGHSLGHSYEWDKMLYSYSPGRYTEEEGMAVATLMYDVGVMNQAQYDISSSDGTGTEVVISRTLPKYMDYDGGTIRDVERRWCSDAEWCRILRKEIDENRPVMYYNDEHAFVLDGYDSADYFAVNFGWGGVADGYYPVSIHKFTRNDNLHFVADARTNGAVIGIQPKRGDGTTTRDFMLHSANYSSLEILRLGGEASCSILFGPLKGSFSGEVSMALVDKDRNIRKIIGNTYSVGNALAEGRTLRATLKCKFDASIAKATDYIAVCYRYSGDSDWSVCTNHLVSVAPTRFLIVKSNYRVGDSFEFALTEGGDYYNVEYYLNDKLIDKGADTVLRSGRHTVKAVVYSDKNTVEYTIVQEINVK